MPITPPDLPYSVWRAELDAMLAAALDGLTAADLPGLLYPDLWEAGLTPAQAARAALRLAIH